MRVSTDARLEDLLLFGKNRTRTAGLVGTFTQMKPGEDDLFRNLFISSQKINKSIYIFIKQFDLYIFFNIHMT